ncbi:MAG: glycoside hydrolase family 57 protein [Nitrososphaerota archaeon]|nr:glycoside hydrolase family 57 protein [Candidatus Bathyarchaeota archaeon]MCX8161818.1 glycoside hydrolase family 57 protein [Candidatus Bathyarchaeota archaeon]MDW8062045.1 glycoside hydrolase family 57 protein [Nitrososphaerota archaeon]
MDLVLVFEVHQPFRLRRRFKGRLPYRYFDSQLDRRILERVAYRCYLPANKIIFDAIEESGGRFKVSFSISGILLKQADAWMPEILDSFKMLADTGCVEFLAQTYYHSLASIYRDRDEFRFQVEKHVDVMKRLFKVKPRILENTELIYSDSIGVEAENLGFEALITEGAERILGWRSPNYLYGARGSGIKILTRNYRLSDDIGFRFSAKDWVEYPLTADKYSEWVASSSGQYILVFVDYETFGEHHPAETGIMEFLAWLPREAIKRDVRFSTPSQVIDEYHPVDEIEVPDSDPVSWADEERNLSAWIGNEMQRLCFDKVERLGSIVKASNDRRALEAWRMLQCSDLLYYQSVKGGGAGMVHRYFSPYESAYEAFARHMSALLDLEDYIEEYRSR